MSSEEAKSNRLSAEFLSRFSKVISTTIEQRSDLSLDEKIAAIGALMQVLNIHTSTKEESVSYEKVGEIVMDLIVQPLRKRAVPITNAKPWDYFSRTSNAYTDYLHDTTGQRSFTDDDFQTEEAHQNFLRHAHNLLYNTRLTLLLASDPGQTDIPATKEEKTTNKEFTLRRQVLVMYYIDKVYNLSNGSDRTNLAHLVELLTGKNYKNIYDYIREPFPDKTSARLIDDLKYIREYFIRLRNDQIIILIDKDIQLHK